MKALHVPVFFVAGVACLMADARAGAPIVVADPNQVVALQARADAFDDPGGQRSLDDVLRLGTGAFKPTNTLPDDYHTVVRWYRFTLVDRAPAGTQWFVAASQFGRSAQLYYPRRNGAVGETRFGWDIPFNERQVRSPIPLAAVTPSMLGKVLYLRTVGEADFPPSIVSSQKNVVYDKVAVGALLGFLLAICISCVLFAIRLRSPMFFWNAAWMFFAAAAFSSNSLVAPEYFWPQLSLPFRAVNGIVYALYLIVATGFSRSFLGEYRPAWFDAAAWSALSVLIGSYLYIDFFAPSPTALHVALAAITLWNVVLLVAGIQAFVRGYAAMRFYLVGLVVASVIAALARVLPSTYSMTVFWLVPVGLAFFAVMLQLAIADRLFLSNRDRESALDAVARERQRVIETQTESVTRLELHNRAFARFVPRDFLEQLGRDAVVNVQLGDHVEQQMVVLFSDIHSFASISEQLTPQENFDFINGYFSRVGPVVREYGGFIDKFVGDAVMALFASPEGALDAAIALQQEVRRFNEARARHFQQPIAIGIGMHFGSLMLGTVGEEQRMDTTVISSAVNVASRIEGLTKRYDAAILVSEALVNRLSDAASYRLRRLGSVQVKGTTQPVGIYEVCDADEPQLMLAKISSMALFEEGVRAFAEGSFERSSKVFADLAHQEPRDGAVRYYCGRARELLAAGVAENWDGIERLDVK